MGALPSAHDRTLMNHIVVYWPPIIPVLYLSLRTVQMSVGVGVVRGPDWPPACHVDGGGPGRVTSVQSDGNVVVKWEKSPAPYKHRWGLRSCFDLALIFPARGAPTYPTYPVHPGMASRGIAPRARPPFIAPRPHGMAPRPRPPFEITYPRPFNSPRGAVYPRPRPSYPRPQLSPGPRPSLHTVNAVPRGLHRCVGGHKLQVEKK